MKLIRSAFSGGFREELWGDNVLKLVTLVDRPKFFVPRRVLRGK
jgi:hypothetical protein